MSLQAKYWVRRSEKYFRAKSVGVLWTSKRQTRGGTRNKQVTIAAVCDQQTLTAVMAALLDGRTQKAVGRFVCNILRLNLVKKLVANEVI